MVNVGSSTSMNNFVFHYTQCAMVVFHHECSKQVNMNGKQACLYFIINILIENCSTEN